MSKTAKKNRSELEVLRGENRKLKSENRHLKKENKRLSKKSHFYEEAVDEVATDVELKSSCENCGKGDIISTDLGLLELQRCSLCDFEKKVRKKLDE